ncbi:MAG TPA: hypothetical protein VFG30_26320 [Polyangiales bacterium]|nr:hypothetical protein [Polyangiales bacterium]
MSDVTHSRAHCPAHSSRWALRAGTFVALACIASCSFDPEGTGDARTLRSSGSVTGKPSDEDSAEAARIAADRLRSARAGEAGESSADAAARPDSSAPDRDRATEAEAAAEASAGNAAPVTGGAVVAADGGSAGQGGPLTSPASGGAAADSGMPPPDESDAGDDSDAGSEPVAGAAGAPPPTAAGTGGAGAGGDGSAGPGGEAGRGGDAGRGSESGRGGGDSGRGAEAGQGGQGGQGGQAPGGSDRELLLSLIEVVVAVMQGDPNGQPSDLLSTLAAATSVDPALITRVLAYVEAGDQCERNDDACERVCDLLAERVRCDECTQDTDCRAALRNTCGSSATECQ